MINYEKYCNLSFSSRRYKVKNRSTRRTLAYGPEAELSELGKDQLRKMGEKLERRGVEIDKIYSSPYPRAIDSAKTIAGVLRISEIIEQLGLEDIHASSSIGLPLEQIIKEGEKVVSLEDETFVDMSKRVWKTFEDIMEKEKGKTIGIVSHGHAIRAVVYLLAHPEVRENIQGLMPNILELQKYDYLNKGEGWKFVVNNEGLRVLTSEFITIREGRSRNRERED